MHLLRAAVDRGIAFFDTADMYAQGESELLVGDALRECRQQVIIATKGGYCLPAQRKFAARIKPLLRPLVQRLGLRRQQLPAGLRGSLTQDFSPSYIVRAVEQSLRRLQTDHIDVYQLHSPPASLLESGDALEPLERLQEQGKIRSYGVACEHSSDALLCLRYPGVRSVQVPLNVLYPQAIDAVLPRTQVQGVGVIARQCFASGLLAQNIDAARLVALFPDETERVSRQSELERWQRVADDQARSLPELALQFVLGCPGVSVTLLGMRALSHLDQNLRYYAAPALPEDMHASVVTGYRAAEP